MLAVLAGPVERPSIRGLRVGYAAEDFLAARPETRAALGAALSDIGRLGRALVPVRLADLDYAAMIATVQAAEGSALYGTRIEGDDLDHWMEAPQAARLRAALGRRRGRTSGGQPRRPAASSPRSSTRSTSSSLRLWSGRHRRSPTCANAARAVACSPGPAVGGGCRPTHRRRQPGGATGGVRAVRSRWDASRPPNRRPAPERQAFSPVGARYQRATDPRAAAARRAITVAELARTVARRALRQVGLLKHMRMNAAGSTASRAACRPPPRFLVVPRKMAPRAVPAHERAILSAEHCPGRPPVSILTAGRQRGGAGHGSFEGQVRRTAARPPRRRARIIGLAQLAERLSFDTVPFPHDMFRLNSWVLRVAQTTSNSSTSGRTSTPPTPPRSPLSCRRSMRSPRVGRR